MDTVRAWTSRSTCILSRSRRALSKPLIRSGSERSCRAISIFGGYHEVESKDGRNDGGSDFAVRTLGGNPLPMAIASTVQQSGWKGKVASDCRRAKEALGLTDVVYISSHRRPAVEFNPIAEELWDQDEIRVRSVYCQRLAERLPEEKQAQVVPEAVGISLDEHRPDAVQRPDLSEDAAYAFALFGEASEEVSPLGRRADGAELSHRCGQPMRYTPGRRSRRSRRAATRRGSDSASHLCDRPDAPAAHAWDSTDGHFTVQESVVESFKVIRALREKQWKELLEKVDGCLAEAGLVGARLGDRAPHGRCEDLLHVGQTAPAVAHRERARAVAAARSSDARRRADPNAAGRRRAPDDHR